MQVAVAVVRVLHQKRIVLAKAAWAAVAEAQEMRILTLCPVMTALVVAVAADH